MFSTLPRMNPAVKNGRYQSWKSSRPTARPCQAVFMAITGLIITFIHPWIVSWSLENVGALGERGRRGRGAESPSFSPLHPIHMMKCVSVLFFIVYMYVLKTRTMRGKRSRRRFGIVLSVLSRSPPKKHQSSLFQTRCCNKSHFWRRGKGTHSGNTDAAVWCGSQEKRKKALIGRQMGKQGGRGGWGGVMGASWDREALRGWMMPSAVDTGGTGWAARPASPPLLFMLSETWLFWDVQSFMNKFIAENSLFFFGHWHSQDSSVMFFGGELFNLQSLRKAWRLFF